MRPHGARIRGLLVLTSVSAALLAGVLTAGPAFAADAIRIDLTGGTPVANQPYTFTITATTAGATDAAYTGQVTVSTAPDGTISATSTGTNPGNPVVYRFTAADAGRHTFSAIWPTNGTKSISAFDDQAHTAPPAQGIVVGGGGGGGANCVNNNGTLTASPSTGSASRALTLSGSNYAQGSTVSFFEDGTSTGITTTASGAGGSFTYNAVASNANGTHTVIARDANGTCGTTTYTVTGSSTTCNGSVCFSLGSSTASPGQSITVSGSGYQGSESIVITADTGQQFTPNLTADAAGNFSGTVTVPTNLTAGSHVITARGNSSGRNDSDTLTVSGTSNCTAGYYNYGSGCVPNNGGSATCPAGYTQNGVQCVPCANGSYPYTQGSPYSQQYPYSQQPYSQQYPYNNGCTGAPTTCPPGYIYNGYACAAAVAAAPPVVIAPPAQQVSPVSSRVPFTGNHTVRMVALALSLLLGGLLLLSARTVAGKRHA